MPEGIGPAGYQSFTLWQGGLFHDEKGVVVNAEQIGGVVGQRRKLLHHGQTQVVSIFLEEDLSALGPINIVGWAGRDGGKAVIINVGSDFVYHNVTSKQFFSL